MHDETFCGNNLATLRWHYWVKETYSNLATISWVSNWIVQCLRKYNIWHIWVYYLCNPLRPRRTESPANFVNMYFGI